jgi:stearoyl-CoA desaturase (delta-9 desaturase)
MNLSTSAAVSVTNDYGHGEQAASFHDDIVYPGAIPFILVHLLCFAVFVTGITSQALWICLILFVVRMFGVSAGYHRYFSHRAFKTSRVGQFVLAWIAQSSAQRGVLWWSARHRHHHKYSDTEDDVHSPRQRGFLYAHVGWVFTRQDDQAARDAVPDLTSYPELRWLSKYQYLPATVLGVATWLIAGWSGLIVGFFWSTVLVYHVTFMINSLAHVHGKQRYVTGDDSRNNWWLAVLTLGEGWHNNHHAYMASTRQGFRWWEIDMTYYVLKGLSWLHIVWDLNEPPAAIVNNTKPLARGVLDKVIHQLVASFPVSQITSLTHESWLHELQTPGNWVNMPTEEQIQAHVHHPENALCELQLPHVPTLEDVRQRAQRMFAGTPSFEDIVSQAHRRIVKTVCTGLVQRRSQVVAMG